MHFTAAKERITKTEMYMVAHSFEMEGNLSMKEIIKEFIDVDGHIDYLQKIEEGQKIAMVLGYPGDNPVGGLFEITVHSSGKQSAKRFATISDGDILCDGKAE